MEPTYIRWFDELNINDISIVGGKNASLGELMQRLRGEGIRVPEGFAITADAYRDLLRDYELDSFISTERARHDLRDVRQLSKCGAVIRKAIEKGKDGLAVYGMCEIPSNVLMADQFLNLFDGYSIGSNDLTQLTLGLDRDSAMVAHLFDERNPAVKRLITDVIIACRERGKYIGICGDAPSTYPEFARFLIEAGIDSISLSPDAVFPVYAALASGGMPK